MTSDVVARQTAGTSATALPDWGAIGERLVAAFPQYSAKEVLAELVQAHTAALYVATPEEDLADVVEFMTTYAMKVRAGQIHPSGRIAPETRSTGPQDVAKMSESLRARQSVTCSVNRGHASLEIGAARFCDECKELLGLAVVEDIDHRERPQRRWMRHALLGGKLFDARAC